MSDPEGWAQAALEQYPVGDYTLCYLGHSDNLTFRVDEAGGTAYLLRLHEPVTSYYRGARQQPEVIAGELAWLEALLGEGGFTVQRPVRTRRGELLAAVETVSGQAVPVTLLTWLDGAHFPPSAPDAGALIERLGELVARLHDFSSRWSPPPAMVRPSYDAGHFRRLIAHLLRGVDLGNFPESIYQILSATGQAILAEIELLPVDPQHWGMIHADLHVGNFLVRAGEIIPIDFSFCGFGHYLFDLSIPLAGGLNAALRPRFIAGYRRLRALADGDLRAIEAYALAGRISYYAYQIDNPTGLDWLKARISQAAENIFRRFVEGRPIMDEF
jgi:Ser/Thr protein kinase RdoA (MazF antagonist)